MLTLHYEFMTRVTCFKCLRFLRCPGKIIDSYFVPIPTLPRNNSGIEPRQVGIFTSLSKVRILTLHRTVPELSVPIPTLHRTYILNQKRNFRKIGLNFKRLNTACRKM